MLKFIATGASVSKGANNTPALKFSEKGDFVRFRIGAKVYDARSAKNHRWVNLTVKAFGPLCERIRKMDLKEGSHINLSGRYDEDVWEDEANTKKTMPVIILDEIEFSGGGNGKKSGDAQGASTGSQNTNPEPAAPAAPQENPQMPGNFTGYEGFGGGNNFFNL